MPYVDAVVGRAVFGTSRGLTVSGNGVLAGVDSEVGVLELAEGRSRDRGLVRLEPDDFVVMYRRAMDETNRPINLLGLVAPCRDEDGRIGFFGSCVAVRTDKRGSSETMVPWAEHLDEIYSLFEQVRSRITPNSGRLQFRGGVVGPSQDDEFIKWQSAPGDTRSYYTEDLADEEVMERLQALAFAEGSRMTTMLVYRARMPDAFPLKSRETEDAVRNFRKAMSEVTRQERSTAHSRSPRSQQPDSQQGSGRRPQKVDPAQPDKNTDYRIRQLEAEVDHIFNVLDELKQQVGGGRSSRPERSLSFERSGVEPEGRGWVFWGVATPWMNANAFTFWFCLRALKNDEDEEAVP